MKRIERDEQPSVAKQVWDLSWGLVLVVVLTVLSECGMRVGLRKQPDGAAPAVAQPVVRVVK